MSILDSIFPKKKPRLIVYVGPKRGSKREIARMTAIMKACPDIIIFDGNYWKVKDRDDFSIEQIDRRWIKKMGKE